MDVDIPDSATTVLGNRPLPRPLHDPLFQARPFVWAALVITLLLTVNATFIDREHPLWLLASTYWLGLLVQITILVVLPRKRAEALYLRSFGHDDASFDARFLVESVLYPGIRLAGIRTPRRRLPLFLRPFLFGVFAFRYLGARYMNLEAGKDWYARLWRTLGNCRAVAIDLREVTDSVRAEIALCVEAMGLQRILFVVDTDWNEDEIRAEIGKSSGKPVDGQLVTAAWQDDSSAAIDAFCAEVQQFGDQLPASAAGLHWESLRRVADSISTRGELLRARFFDWLQLALGFAVVVLLNLPFEGKTEAFTGFLASANQNPFFIFFAYLLGGFFVAFAIGGIVSLLRPNPLARKAKTRSRVLLLKTQRANTAFIWGFAFIVASTLTGLSYFAKHELGKAEVAQARAKMHKLVNAFEMYRMDSGSYPGGDNWKTELQRNAMASLRESDFLDPWGNQFRAEFPAGNDGPPVLHSNGPDGRPGTSDDVGLGR